MPLHGPSVLLTPAVALMVKVVGRSIPADLQRLRTLMESSAAAPTSSDSRREATQAQIAGG